MRLPTASRVRFFNGNDGAEIAVGSLRILLPSGQSFELHAEPGRGEAALFVIPGGTPRDRSFRTFVIEPGACNVFSVNVVEAPRRTDGTDGDDGA